MFHIFCHVLTFFSDGGRSQKKEKGSGSGVGVRVFICACECVVFCTHARPHEIASDRFFLKCVIVHHNYTCPNYVCAYVFNYPCVHAFQACSIWAPACFQYSLLLGGDYPACIWLLSAFDWKLERPGAPWEERSENFLNPAFTPTPQPLQEPPHIHTGVVSINNRKFWIGRRNVEVVLRLFTYSDAWCRPVKVL